MPIISYSYTHSILYILYTHTCAHTRFLKHSHRGKWLTLQFASDCAISFMSVQLARDWASQHTQTETHYYPHAQLIESHAVLRLCARDKYSARISESAREKCVCSTVCAFFFKSDFSWDHGGGNFQTENFYFKCQSTFSAQFSVLNFFSPDLSVLWSCAWHAHLHAQHLSGTMLVTLRTLRI